LKIVSPPFKPKEEDLRQVVELQVRESGGVEPSGLEGDVKKGLFPAEIEPEQIIELTELLTGQDVGMDVLKLGKILGIGIDETTRLLNASQILGFTKIHDGCIWLSDRGTELNSLPRSEKRHLLRERLSLVEPFRTAIEIAGQVKSLESSKVTDILSLKELRWAEDDELNDLLVHDILVDWAIFTGLLEYDGKTDRFTLIS